MTVLLPFVKAAPYRKVMNGGQSDMPGIPWVDADEIDLSDFGVASVVDGPTNNIGTAGERPELRSLLSSYWRGCGLTVDSDGSIFDSDSHHNYIGARAISSDTEISRCRLFDNRDANLFINGVGGTSNIQSLNNHCYGSRIACYNEGSQSFRALNDIYADSMIGYFGDFKAGGSHQATFTNIFFQHNFVRDCIFTCTSNHLSNCIVNIGKDTNERHSLSIPGIITRDTQGAGNKKVGVELEDRCSIRGGVVELADYILTGVHTPSGNPCEGVWVMPNATSVVIDTLFVDWQGINGAVAVHVKGPVSGLRINISTVGFHHPNSRLLVIDDPTHCKGLDITIRCSGNDGALTSGTPKTINQYIDTGAGWQGTLQFQDCQSGAHPAITEGAAI